MVVTVAMYGIGNGGGINGIGSGSDGNGGGVTVGLMVVKL